MKWDWQNINCRNWVAMRLLYFTLFLCLKFFHKKKETNTGRDNMLVGVSFHKYVTDRRVLDPEINGGKSQKGDGHFCTDNAACSWQCLSDA